MKTFVQGRNGRADDCKESGQADGRRNFDDSKMPLPTSRPAQNVNPSGVKAPASKRPVNVKMEADDDHYHAAPRRLSGGRGAFYDTDASSIGQTSTAASMNGEVANAANEQGEEFSSDVNGENDVEDEEGEPDEADHHAYAMQPDEAESRARARALERQLQIGGVAGTGLPFIKGDSYPSTTSGNPSVSEVPNGGAAHRVEPQRGLQTKVHNLPNRQSNQRRSLTSTPGITPLAQIPGHAPQNQAEAAFTGRLNGSTQDPISQIQSGFTFAAGPQQQKHAPATTRNHQQKAVISAGAPTISTNTAQPSTGYTNGGMSRDLLPAQKQQLSQKHRDHEMLQNVSNTTQNRQLPQDSVGRQDQHVRFDSIAERFPDQHEEMDDAQGHGRNSHPTGEQLDYDIDQLHEMNYPDLKKEPFDVNPNAQELDNGQQQEVIADRMTAIRMMQTEAQVQFFSGLPIREWEEGGDWFLDQFSNVLKQLKDVRQQRRKAAQEYEEEIEGRFMAVGQKRKQIDVALSEMRETGDKVLQGTPKKTKTK